MGKKKIISILPSSPPDFLLKASQDVENYKQNMGNIDFLDVDEPVKRVYFYLTEHNHILLANLAQRNPDYDYECWRPYAGISKSYSKKTHGITHRIFPASVNDKMILFSKIRSKSMEEGLRQEMMNSKILIISAWPSTMITRMLIKLKTSHIPVILIHRGWRLSHFVYQDFRGIKKLNLLPLIKDRWELKCLRKYADLLRVNTPKQIDYLAGKGIHNILRCTDGFDFDYYKPSSNKAEVRKELNLPVDKKIILYVGRFIRTKDVDFLIDVYRQVQKTRDDVTLLLVGGYETDEFYRQGVDCGAIMVSRVPKDKLVKYYQSADIYTLPTRNSVVLNFGGIGGAVIESLACGVPVISDHLLHFQGTEAERNKLGMMLGNKDQMIAAIEHILNNKELFNDCRETARKYYGLSLNLDKMLSSFDELFEKHY